MDQPDFFAGWTAQELREFERVTSTRAFSRGSVLYQPGETGEALFVLRQGAVQIYRLSPDGRRLVIAHLLPVSLFGEMSCIGQGMHENFAEVTEDATILTMDCAILNRLLTTKPDVARRILQAFGRRVLDAERQFEDSVFKTIPTRLAALLLREARGSSIVGLTHQDLATDWASTVGRQTRRLTADQVAKDQVGHNTARVSTYGKPAIRTDSADKK